MNSVIRSAENDLYQFISYANTTEDAESTDTLNQR
jgi:hypothetical protein